MILIVVATFAEWIWIPRRPNIRRVITGMGRKAGESISSLLEQKTKPSFVLSTGFCGGLTPAIDSGTIILVRAIDYQGQDILVKSAFLARAKKALAAAGFPFEEGKIVTTENVLHSPEEKQRLSHNGAIAVDMESGVIYRVAQAAGIECLPLRIVLDERDWQLPFAGDFWDLVRVIFHPVLALRLTLATIVAGRILRRAIAVIARELAPRREECVA